jgi:hypothetical protein
MGKQGHKVTNVKKALLARCRLDNPENPTLATTVYIYRNTGLLKFHMCPNNKAIKQMTLTAMARKRLTTGASTTHNPRPKATIKLLAEHDRSARCGRFNLDVLNADRQFHCRHTGKDQSEGSQTGADKCHSSVGEDKHVLKR